MSTTMPWDDEGEDSYNDDFTDFDDEEQWLKIQKNNWLPNVDLDPQSITDSRGNGVDEKYMRALNLTLGRWDRIAKVCGATNMSQFKAWQTHQNLEIILEKPDVEVCEEGCKHHGELAAYVPNQRKLHVPMPVLKKIEDWIHIQALRRDFEESGIDAGIGNYIHHTLCESAYDSLEGNTSRDKACLQACVGRLTEFICNKLGDTKNVREVLSHEYQAMKRYKRLFQKKPEAFDKATVEQKGFLQSGWGKILANEIYNLDSESMCDVAYFGDRGEGSHDAVLQCIIRTGTLEDAAEALLQKVEGPIPDQVSEMRIDGSGENAAWERMKDFYTACAYKFLALNNFIYGKGKEIPVKG